MNVILGQKISIVTPKPQTTRARILGVLNRHDAQIVFIDAPGIHKPREKLHKIMVNTAIHALEEAECVIFVVPPALPGKDEHYILKILQKFPRPVILAINKIDLVPKPAILTFIDAYRTLHDFQHIVPISALHKTNVPTLVSLIAAELPPGPPLFPEHSSTDRPENFRIAEIIREKVFLYTQNEIPYSAAVIIENRKETKDKPMTVINACIIVEKNSHKGILIGKNGIKLKQIGQDARKDIERLLDTRIYLELYVKCVPNWKENSNLLAEMGLV
jgi:GTP-binding protein Era